MNRAAGQTGYARVWGRNYSEKIVVFGETVYGLAAENCPGSGAYSKWQSRWSRGSWVGKDERNDEPMVFVDGDLRPFRCVQRSWTME